MEEMYLQALAEELSKYNAEDVEINREALRLLAQEHKLNQYEKIVWLFDHDADRICEALQKHIKSIKKGEKK